MAVICKYCGKDLPREYAPGESSEFCIHIKGGRKKKDGTAGTERILHFCSKACVEWKTYKDKINRHIGRLNAGQISSSELYGYIDKLVKPSYEDPMATAEAPVTTLEPLKDEPHYDEPEAVETPTEAVQAETEATNEQNGEEESKVMPEQKKKTTLKRTIRQIDMEGQHIQASITTYKNQYFVGMDLTTEEVSTELISEMRELADAMELLLGGDAM